jgi:hypothetical protein
VTDNRSLAEDADPDDAGRDVTFLAHVTGRAGPWLQVIARAA